MVIVFSPPGPRKVALPENRKGAPCHFLTWRRGKEMDGVSRSRRFGALWNVPIRAKSVRTDLVGPQLWMLSRHGCTG